MKEIRFNVYCSGIYTTSLMVDDDFCDEIDGNDIYSAGSETIDKILDYVNSHLNEANVTDIDWIEDFAVEGDDLQYVCKIEI